MRRVPSCRLDYSARRVVRRAIALQRLAGRGGATWCLALRGGFEGTPAPGAGPARRGGDARPTPRLVR